MAEPDPAGGSGLAGRDPPAVLDAPPAQTGARVVPVAVTSELFRALALIAESPTPATKRVAETLELPGDADPAEYTDLFVLQLWPYASIYVGKDGKLGGEARDRVAGFWRALGLNPPVEPDHLATLLGLQAALIEREADEREPARKLLARRARRALLSEHLLSWLPVYLAKLQEVATPFYRAWGRLVSDALFEEGAEVGFPEHAPLHLRLAPDLTSPDDVLVPVKSGMLLVRDDLARAARSLGLGLRQGERSYVLRALLEQDPVGTLKWIGAEAERWVELHGSMPGELGPIRDFWLGRAALSARQLGAGIPA